MSPPESLSNSEVFDDRMEEVAAADCQSEKLPMIENVVDTIAQDEIEPEPEEAEPEKEEVTVKKETEEEPVSIPAAEVPGQGKEAHGNCGPTAEMQLLVANLYRNGGAVEENQTTALQWYKCAAAQGSAAAHMAIGEILVREEGMEEDAMQHFMKAAELGHGDALCAAARAYLSGHRVQEDDTLARQLWTIAAEHGHSSSQSCLEIYFAKDRDLAYTKQQLVQWVREQRDGLSDHACLLATQPSCLAEDGSLRTDAALLLAGIDDHDGQHHVTIERLTKAAEEGVAEAQFFLGCCYDKGACVDKDEDQACRWWGEAARKECASAAFALGCTFLTGDRENDEFDEASRLFATAAARGHAAADEALQRARVFERAFGAERAMATVFAQSIGAIAGQSGNCVIC